MTFRSAVGGASAKRRLIVARLVLPAFTALVSACSPEATRSGAPLSPTSSAPGTGGSSAMGNPGVHPEGTIGGSTPMGVASTEYPDPLRRLSAVEYRRSVQDALGVAADQIALPADETVGAFTANSVTPVTSLHIDNYDLAAKTLAQSVDLGRLEPCALTSKEPACARSFIEKVGSALYRRPLSNNELDALLGVQTLGMTGASFEAGLRLAVRAMLESPDFLYLVESPDPKAPRRLAPHSLAARMSYFLTGTTPDAELSGVAGSGELARPEVLRAQAERLLASSGALPQLERFHLEWLGLRRLPELDKDLARFPSFTRALALAMQRETASFVDFVIQKSDATLATLFTAPFSVVEDPLLQVYGLAGSPGRDATRPIALNPSQRAGLLTQPGVLALHSHRDTTSPVHRGIFVLQNLLCQPLAPPPPGVSIPKLVAAPGTQLTKREILSQHEADPQCGGCHRLVDPIGLAFENYDALGAYRSFDPDEQQPVNASVQITTGTDIDGAYANGLELTTRLSQSPALAQCVVKQWFRFALGRLEIPQDAKVLAQLEQRFTATDHDVRDLIRSIVLTDAFSQRPNRSAQ
ncbi:MAG: DUF1592 domain-containing protein [Polyangiaceae bacterium]|nr:DUF1592 domain-containing protein [Polyangiaceae bacterium]